MSGGDINDRNLTLQYFAADNIVHSACLWMERERATEIVCEWTYRLSVTPRMHVHDLTYCTVSFPFRMDPNAEYIGWNMT